LQHFNFAFLLLTAFCLSIFSLRSLEQYSTGKIHFAVVCIIVHFHSPGGVSAPAVTASRRTWPCVAEASKGPVTRHPAAGLATAGGKRSETLRYPVNGPHRQCPRNADQSQCSLHWQTV